MLGAFKFVHFDAKHVIIQQGDRGDEFYVLESGTVEFHVESRGRSARAAWVEVLAN